MQSNVETKIKWAAVLVLAGLLCIFVSFSKVHPLAFIAFLIIACPLTLGGVLLFLVALLQKDTTREIGPHTP